jgi:protein-disulfide isomerase
MLYGIIILGLALLLVLSIFTQGFGIIKPAAVNQSGPVQPSGNQSGNVTPPASVKTLKAPSMLSDMPLMGSSGSAVTVVEFSDFQCPFCGMAFGSPWTQAYASDSRYGPIIGTVQKLETDYVKTGKVAFRHSPVAFLGDESTYSSLAALCANAQGKYWEMHDVIFNAQTTEENDGKYSKSNLKLLARNVSGIDAATFDSCLDADTYSSKVDAFTSDWGSTSRSNTGNAGTPTFYILVDAAKVSSAKVSSAANAGGYDFGITSDNKTYVILADPEYANIKKALDGLLN